MTADGLTDDVLTQGRLTETPRAYLRDAVDRLAGADPGLTQLRTALQSVLGIAVAVGLVPGCAGPGTPAPAGCCS
jgi:hypothetical protein